MLNRQQKIEKYAAEAGKPLTDEAIIGLVIATSGKFAFEATAKEFLLFADKADGSFFTVEKSATTVDVIYSLHLHMKK